MQTAQARAGEGEGGRDRGNAAEEGGTRVETAAKSDDTVVMPRVESLSVKRASPAALDTKVHCGGASLLLRLACLRLPLCGVCIVVRRVADRGQMLLYCTHASPKCLLRRKLCDGHCNRTACRVHQSVELGRVHVELVKAFLPSTDRLHRQVFAFPIRMRPENVESVGLDLLEPLLHATSLLRLILDRPLCLAQSLEQLPQRNTLAEDHQQQARY